MSLLDRGRDTVIVYPEETFVDEDGNELTRPSSVGIETRACIQLLAQSGTSARRAEQDNEGFETEEVYRMRLPRSFTTILGAQSRVDWRGQYWAVIGEVRRYNGSSKTRHFDYVIRRT